MPFVLLITGVVLLISAVRNTQQQLFFLLANDFTGQNNFIYWFLSILIIGAVGYIPKAKPVSDGFMILVILVLFLRKGTGFFDMFQKQIASTTSATPKVSAGGTTNFVGSSGGSSGGVSIGISGGGGGIRIGGGGIGISFPTGGLPTGGIPGSADDWGGMFAL